jgi:hypothetical protein
VSKDVIVPVEALVDFEDPREVRKVRVSELIVDQNVQRSVLQPRLDKMGEWNWDLAETLTVTERADGKYVVTEGQGRVLKLLQDHPTAVMWAVVRTAHGEDYAADEAAVARAISGGRTPHSTFDRMDLERTAGDLYWQEATRRLLEFGIEMTGTRHAKSPRAISAVSAIGTIMHAFDAEPDITEGQAIQAGGDLLSDTAAVILEAFGEQPGMWERLMLMVTSGAMIRHSKLDKARLAATLKRLSPADWRAESKRHRPGTSALDHLGMLILADYSHGKSNKLAW